MKLARRERQGLDLSWAADPHDAATELAWRNLRPVLDQEVSRLPEKYRAPFVLCYFEGQNYEQAAQQLGCPKGTISTRLTRARELLRGRLARHGLAVTTGTLAAALSQEVAKSSVPAALVGCTIKAGSLLTIDKAAGALSGQAFALAEGVTKAMFVTKLKLAAAFLLSASILATGAGLVAHQAWGAKEPNKQHEDAPHLAAKTADLPSAKSEAEGRVRTDRYGDPLPPGALARLGTVRFRHGNQIQALAYSPDGKTIASGGIGGIIRLWEAASGKPCRTLVGHKAYVFSLAYSADGKRLVSTGSENMSTHNQGKLILWDIAAGRPLYTVNHDGSVRTAALSADGRMLAMGCDDGTFRLLDVATGKTLHDFGKPTRLMNGLAFSPDSRLLAASGANHTIQLWDTATHQEHMKLQDPTALRAVTFSPDGKKLATAHDGAQFSDDALVRVWDVATGKNLHTLRGHKGNMVFSVSFSPDGKCLASGGMNGLVLVWDVQSGKQLATHQFLKGWFQAVAFSPDGRSLAAGSSSGRIQIWDVATGVERFLFDEHSAGIAGIALSPDASTLATASADHSVRIWDVATARQRGILRGNEAGVYKVDFGHDGKLVTSGGDGSVRFWDPITCKEESRMLLPAKKWASRAFYSPSGRLVATAKAQLIQLWDAATEKEVRQLKGHEGIILALRFSPDEKLLASVASSFSDEKGMHEDWTVRLWDVASGQELHRFEQVHGGTPAFWPDGRVLAYLDHDERRMRCRDVFTGRERSAPKDKDITAYAFSPEGQWLATGHAGGSIRIREQATGQEILHFEATPSGVNQLIWAPDGKKLYSNNGDATVLIWDLTPPHRNGEFGQKRLQPDLLERAWADLKLPDAKRAYSAIWLLTAGGDDAVALLKRRLPSATKSGNAGRIRRLVADLDHEKFARREAASRLLTELGAAAEPALVRALANQPSAEARSRIEALLNHLASDDKQPTAEELQLDRGLVVLERIGSPAARQVLELLSKGAPEAILGQKAEAALRRLRRRPAAQ